MGQQCGNMIADAASVGINYAKRLSSGISAERFARFAAPGGKVVEANHPAFALGHLCLYPAKVLQLLGQDPQPAAAPPEFETLFSKDARCQDDAAGTLYPSSEALVSCFERTYAAAIAALRQATDEQLAAENPNETPMKKLCPSLGALLNFYMTGHVTTHLGQISTWRRMEGLPPA